MSAKIKSPHNPKKLHHRHKPRGISHSAFDRAYWPYLPMLAVVGILFSLVIRGGAFASLTHPGEIILGYATSMNINDLTKSTNVQREKNGLSPLKLNNALDLAAETKAQDMVKLDYWSHNTPSGNPPWVFVASTNYSYQALGENLAAGFNDENSVINAWMASAQHRSNILNRAYSQVGFGVAQSPNYKSAGGGPMTVVVAYYAKPAPSVVLATADSPYANQSVSTPSGATTSHAQLALAGSPIASSATAATIAFIIAMAALWLSRHARSIKRIVRRGEMMAIAHPMVDLLFAAIIFLAYLMTQTAGFIK